MITVNQTRWTDPNETHELYEYFTETYGPDVAKPACNWCGHTTCYVVEDAAIKYVSNKPASVRPTRKGVAYIINLTKASLLAKENLAYIPILTCNDCDARFSARHAFKAGIKYPPDLSTHDMTDSEKSKWRTVFGYKIGDLQTESDEKIAATAGRYKL